MKSNNQVKVLLVDDEPNILVALEFLMEQQGYSVRTSYNGISALRAIENELPDIIILDVMMPEMDGFEVAKTVRDNPACGDIPIVFLTAKGTQEDKWKGYESGGEVYLIKPFDNDELVNTIKELVAYN